MIPVAHQAGFKDYWNDIDGVAVGDDIQAILYLYLQMASLLPLALLSMMM